MELVDHTNTSADDLGAALDLERSNLHDLREHHGERYTLRGTEVTISCVADHSSAIWASLTEIRHLEYELECCAAMARSELSLGDLVEVGPAWCMGPVVGDGGVYVHDGITGRRGRVLRFQAGGEDVKIADDDNFDYAPACRLKLVSDKS